MTNQASEVLQGDCLELMKDIPDGSVDMILADLPYGTTACKWDTIIPFEPLWEQYKRIIKPNGAIVMTASQPFTTTLISSNIKMFKYCWYWDKEVGSGSLLAKIQPLRSMEDICVFYKKQPIYNPQMEIRKKENYRPLPKKNGSEIYNINPQVIDYNNGEYIYPKSRIVINGKGKELNSKYKVHPTQKPVALMEYLIKTYTDEGDLVLDNVAGSGTTGVAAMNTNRNFILMEQEPEYVEIIKKRLELNKERLNDQSS
jgi:site-specific DNA-methyltransferase (adenine-specific)